RAPQRLLDLTQSVAVVNRRTGVLEQVIQVEAEAVAARRDAGVDDVESELIERRGGAREAVAPRAREDQHRGGAAHAVRIERHQRFIGTGFALGQQLRVPGDLLGGVLQEIAGAEARPYSEDARLAHLVLEQQAPR